jgi:hypothetical protein
MGELTSERINSYNGTGGSGTPGPESSNWRPRSCGRCRTSPSLLKHRRRAEPTPAPVVATSYLLGSRPGG